MKKPNYALIIALSIVFLNAYALFVLNPYQDLNRHWKSGMQNHVLLDKGWQSIESSEYNEAIQVFNQVISNNQKCKEAFNGRGWAFHCLSEQKKAISDFNKAISLNSAYANAYNNRGVAFRTLGDYEKAINDFTKALDSCNNHVFARINRGFLLALSGKTQDSLKDFDLALTNNPNCKEAYVDRSFIHGFILDDTDKALRDLQKALVIDPDFWEIYLNRGILHYMEQRYAQAAKDLEKACTINPGNKSAQNWLLLSKQRIGMEHHDYASIPNPDDKADHITKMLNGYISPETVLHTIKDKSRLSAEFYCEVCFFIAEYHDIRQNSTKALKYYKECIDTGQNDCFEYAASRNVLRRLDSI